MGHSVAFHLMEVSCKDENMEQKPVNGIPVHVRHVCLDSKHGSLAVFRFWLRISLRSIISACIPLVEVKLAVLKLITLGQQATYIGSRGVKGSFTLSCSFNFPSLPFLLIFTLSNILIKVIKIHKIHTWVYSTVKTISVASVHWPSQGLATFFLKNLIAKF